MLGPASYVLPQPVWTVEPRRLGSPFSSKSPKIPPTPHPITQEVDYLNKPELFASFRNTSPGSRSLPWVQIDAARPHTGVPAEHDVPEEALRRFQSFDRFRSVDQIYDVDYPPKQHLATAMTLSARKYASSFASADKRFRPKTDTTGTMGPGMYDTATATVQIHDPKRSSSAFKTELATSFKPQGQTDPPDMIHDPLLANQAKTWTHKGFAFSTRERFPRTRPRWQD